MMEGLTSKKVVLKAPSMTPPVPSGIEYQSGLLNNEQGWLAPDGSFYPCAYGAHGAEAKQIHLPGVSFVPTKGTFETYPDLLQRCGWIQITGRVPYFPSYLRLDEFFPVTKAQFVFINDYLHYHGSTDILHFNFRIRSQGGLHEQI